MYLKFLDLPVAALESQRLTMSWKNPDSLITCKCCSSNSDENIMAVFIKDKKSGIKNEKWWKLVGCENKNYGPNSFMPDLGQDNRVFFRRKCLLMAHFLKEIAPLF